MGGPESEGHLTGAALKALFQHVVGARKRILGTEASHAILHNLSREAIERFRLQVSLIDLQFEGELDILRQAISACYQERAVNFRGYYLYDHGAYHEPPITGQITWRVTQDRKSVV